MTAQSPSAYGLSAFLHAAVIGIVLFFSYEAMSVVKETPKIMELVQGEGDNYMATEAPALGVEGGLKIPPPVVKPEPLPEPKPAPQEASPIQAAPETPPVAKPAKAPAKPADLLAQLKKVEQRKIKRMENQYKKEREAEEKREKAEAAREKARVDAEGIRKGVLGGSTSNKEGGANGKALSREEASELDAYFSLIKSRIKENHAPPETSAENLSTKVEFFLAADGSISHVRVLRSSGSPEFDRSVVDACERTQSNPAKPDHKGETIQMTFKLHEDEGN